MSRISFDSQSGSVDWGRPQASPTRRKIEKAISKVSTAVLNTFIEDTKLEDVDPIPEHIVGFEYNYKFDPNATPHKDLILGEANHRVQAVEYEGKYQVKKWWYFSCCIFCNIIGIFVTLFSLGKSNLFESFEPNIILTYCSAIFYVPTLIWLRVIFCPGKEESLWRRFIMQQRAWRRKVYHQQRRVYLGHDVEEAREAEAEAIAKAVAEAHSTGRSTKLGADVLDKIAKEKVSGKGKGSSNKGGPGKTSSSIVQPPPPLTPILQGKNESRKSIQSSGLSDKKSSKRISFQV